MHKNVPSVVEEIRIQWKNLGFSGTESPIKILLLHSLKNRSCLLFDVFRGVCQFCWKTSPGHFWLKHEWEKCFNFKVKTWSNWIVTYHLLWRWRVLLRLKNLWWNMILWTFLYKIWKLSEAKKMKKSARKQCSRRKKIKKVRYSPEV